MVQCINMLKKIEIITVFLFKFEMDNGNEVTLVLCEGYVREP